jgi:flagellin-like hook-associated protein FlgL
MSIVINTNSAATVAAYNLRGIGAEHQRNLTRLTTGLRINSSSDDAAGMAVSMKMSAQIRRADAYSANIANSRSFLQTQDAALAQLGKLLERMSELKALAHDVTKNGGDVDLYEKEYIQLQEQFAKTTTEQFNGISLFSPTSTPDPLILSYPERGDYVQISRPAMGDLNTGETLKVGQNNFSIVSGLFTWNAAKADAESRGGRLAVIDSAEKQAWAENLLPSTPIMQFWIGLNDAEVENNWQWINGNSLGYNKWATWEPSSGLDDEDYVAITTGGWGSINKGEWNDNPPLGFVNGYVFEAQIKTGLLDLPWSDLQSSIQQVGNARAQNGAEQMRLQMESDLNATNTTNLEEALSRVQDLDIAQATSDLSRTKVLMEAGTAMLAQANQSSKSILSLIMQN